MKCINCQEELKDGAKFCGKCGTFQLEIKPHFCGKCGCKITDSEDKICAACRASEKTSIPAPTPAPASTPAPAPTPAPASTHAPEQAPAPKKKGSKAPKIIAVILGVLILGEVGYYYLFSMGGMEKIKAAMAETSSSESSSAQAVLPSSSETPHASGSQSASTPATSAPASSAPASSAPAATEAPVAIPSYNFEDWDSKIAEKRTGFIPDKATFIEVHNAQELSDFDEGIARVKEDGQWGFLLKPEDGWVKMGYDIIMPFSEDMAAVCSEKKWGYVDKTLDSSKEIPCTWDSAGSFTEGYAVVSQGKKFGLIDKTGKVIIEPYYENMRAYSNGVVPVCENGKWGFVDLSDRTVLPFEYSDAGPFVDGLAVVAKDNVVYYIDKSGNKRTKEFDDAWSFNENHTAKVKVGDQYGLINTDGSYLINPVWDNIWNLQEGVATVQRDGRFGYVSQSDNIVTVQPVYSDVWSSSFGLIPIKTQNGKWGYIDRVGNTVIEPQFDEAYNFAEGVARVGKAGKYSLIDVNGQQICPYQYKLMGYVREGYCPVVNLDGKWGYLKISYK